MHFNIIIKAAGMYIQARVSTCSSIYVVPMHAHDDIHELIDACMGQVWFSPNWAMHAQLSYVGIL